MAEKISEKSLIIIKNISIMFRAFNLLMSANFLMDFLRHRKEGEVRGFLIIQKMLEVGGWKN